MKVLKLQPLGNNNPNSSNLYMVDSLFRLMCFVIERAYAIQGGVKHNLG